MKTNLRLRFFIPLLLLCLSLVAVMPAWAGGTHYLTFASDRHANTTAISTAMSCWKELPVEYVSMIGDMVGASGGDAPKYDVKTVWEEVNAVFPP